MVFLPFGSADLCWLRDVHVYWDNFNWFFLIRLSKLPFHLERALSTPDSSLGRYFKKYFRKLPVNGRRYTTCVSQPENVKTRRWGCSLGSPGWSRYSSGCGGRGLGSSDSLWRHCSPSKPCHKLNEKQNYRSNSKNKLTFALPSLKSSFIK